MAGVPQRQELLQPVRRRARALARLPGLPGQQQGDLPALQLRSAQLPRRSLALIETRLVLARLLWNFDLGLNVESKNENQQRLFLLYEKRPLNTKVTAVNYPERGVAGGVAEEERSPDGQLGMCELEEVRSWSAHQRGHLSNLDRDT